jgi:hypothetical protein
MTIIDIINITCSTTRLSLGVHASLRIDGEITSVPNFILVLRNSAIARNSHQKATNALDIVMNQAKGKKSNGYVMNVYTLSVGEKYPQKAMVQAS